jgi:hypothetical protein
VSITYQHSCGARFGLIAERFGQQGSNPEWSQATDYTGWCPRCHQHVTVSGDFVRFMRREVVPTVQKRGVE